VLPDDAGARLVHGAWAAVLRQSGHRSGLVAA